MIETGLGEFASDWVLVQQRVEKATRICTYDRAGYGSSDSGPMPRTPAQLNLELHELLQRAGEKAPFILVGHSFGGMVVRSYAARYPDDVAGMVLAESVAEHQPLILGGKPAYLKDHATGKPLPAPSLSGPLMTVPPAAAQQSPAPLPEDASVLPPQFQALHQRFAAAAALEATENSQREWSDEYFADWDRHPQKGLLGSKPLIVMTRAFAGYTESPNYSAAEVDGQRLRGQTEQLTLSSNSMQLVLQSGHDVQLDAPGAVASAIATVTQAVRRHTPVAEFAVERGSTK